MEPSKKPVTILQEMMTKKNCIVTYDLIHNGNQTHENLFVYKVECDGLSAEGSGRVKKDAKHKAAEAMLKLISEQSNLLQITATSDDVSPVQASMSTNMSQLLPNVPFFNAVGQLKVTYYYLMHILRESDSPAKERKNSKTISIFRKELKPLS